MRRSTVSRAKKTPTKKRKTGRPKGSKNKTTGGYMAGNVKPTCPDELGIFFKEKPQYIVQQEKTSYRSSDRTMRLRKWASGLMAMPVTQAAFLTFEEFNSHFGPFNSPSIRKNTAYIQKRLKDVGVKHPKIITDISSSRVVISRTEV